MCTNSTNHDTEQLGSEAQVGVIAVDSKPEKWTPVLPPPANAKETNLEHALYGKPRDVYRYTNPSGITTGYVATYDTPKGQVSRTIVYCLDQDGRGMWRSASFPEPHPLYGLFRLAQAKSDAHVLLMQGERPVEMTSRFCDPGVVCLTWPGGCEALPGVDFSPLQGRYVGIWPGAGDLDPAINLVLPGLLKEAGALGVSIITPPADAPAGWNLADAKDWSPDSLTSWIADNSNTLDEPQEVEEEQEEDCESPALAEQTKGGMALVCAADVKAESVNWIWPGHVAAGAINLLEGAPGVTKSMLTCKIAAVVTTGGVWPDGTNAQVGNVIMINLEDGLAQTIRPRLEAVGAELNRITLLDVVTENFILEDDLQRLEAEIVARGVKLVIIDPLMAAFGAKTDAYRDQHVRRVLSKLTVICGKTGCGALLVRHVIKSSGPRAISNGGGSVGIIAAARVALLLAIDPENEKLRILATVKNNLGGYDPTLSTAWGITDGRLECCGTVSMSADDLSQAQGKKQGTRAGRPEEKQSAAKEWLSEELANGPVPSTILMEHAEAAGHAKRTIERVRKEITDCEKVGGIWQVALHQVGQDRQNSVQ